MTGRAGAVAALTIAYRTEWAQVLATVARVSRDLDVAEDCTQDAFAQACCGGDATGFPIARARG